MINPNYTYSGALAPLPQISNPTTGLSAIADALIHGYSGYLQNQQRGAPMQLQGGQAQPGLMAAIFGQPAAAAPAFAPSPMDSGAY